MAIKTKDELMAVLRERMGEGTDDDSLSLMEDISDTFTDLERRSANSREWETKYKENDAAWRQKYHDRFYAPSPEPEPEPEPEAPKRAMTYTDLFKEGG